MRLANPISTLVCATITLLSVWLGHPDSLHAEKGEKDEPAKTLQQTLRPGRVLMKTSELTALKDQLKSSVFRAFARQPAGKPYRDVPLEYDGAVVAFDHEGLGFLTSAGWLTGATEIVLVIDKSEVELVVEKIDVQADLALLRFASTPDDVERFVAVPLVESTPMIGYSLLSPGTRYELLASASLVGENNPTALGLGYWVTDLAASNGYSIFDADGGLVAVIARRTDDAEKGLALGWIGIDRFLHDKVSPWADKTKLKPRVLTP